MIKHPLVQKEWKTTRWIMIVLTLIYGGFAITLKNSISSVKNRYLLTDFVDAAFMNEVYRMSILIIPVMLIGIIVLVIILFSHDRNSSIGKFTSSLPFNRKEQFTIKYIMGIITFIVPFILFSLTVIIMRIQNEKWISHLYKYSVDGAIQTKQDGLGSLLLWLGIMGLIMLAVYAFLMFIQTLMGQNIIAGVLGAIIYIVPWFLGFAIPANIQLIFKKYWGNNVLGSVAFFFCGNPSSSVERITRGTQSVSGDWTYMEIYEYQNLSINIGILVMIIIISTLLAYHFIQTNDVEKNGELIMYPWAGKVLIAGVTVCSLLLLPILVTIFTQIESKILSLVLMVVGGIVGYMISKKSIEITQKHG